MNHRIVDQMILSSNHQIQQALPVSKSINSCAKARAGWRILALHHVFSIRSGRRFPILNRGDQITGKMLLLVIAFIQRKPAKFIFPAAPLRDERLSYRHASGAGDHHETVIVRAESLASNRSLQNHGGVFKAGLGDLI